MILTRCELEITFEHMKMCVWQNPTFGLPMQACKMYDVNAVFFGGEKHVRR